jgi:hypothetical protein
MPPKAPPRPPRGRGPSSGSGGTGLNKKIAGVPAKYLLAAAVAVVGYLLYRHYKANAGTSAAGSTSTPADQTVQPPAPADSLGGGSSGGGDIASPTDVSGQAADLASSLLQSLAGLQQPPGATNYYYGYGAGTPQGTGGGNTTPPPEAILPSQPPTSQPPPGPAVLPTLLAATVTPTAQAVSGGTVFTFTPAQQAAISQMPNALNTIGSDAAQSAAKTTAAAAKTAAAATAVRPAGTGGARIQSQVKARSL